MTPEEKIIMSVEEFLKKNGPCMARPGSDVCVCGMKQALHEYKNTPKPWTPPWSVMVPDWAAWATLNKNGVGYFWERYPPPNHCPGFSEGRFMYIGKFEIPPGMDWREMKVRVR